MSDKSNTLRAPHGHGRLRVPDPILFTQEPRGSCVMKGQNIMFPKRLLLVLVFSLALIKPAVRYPIVAADIVFFGTACAWGASLLMGRSHFRWSSAYWAIAAYLAGLAASLAVSNDLGQSAFKISTVLYLASLT